MLITILILFILLSVVYLFLQLPQFGRAPSGERLKIIKNAPNYKDGQFQNQSPTPSLTDGATYTQVMKKFFFEKNKRSKPSKKLPSKKTDLLHLDPEDNILVWFGHSSYFMQLDGKKILVDPVFSGHASPLSFTTKSFDGSDIYTTDEMPVIDYLFISHDHYDHLDYKTIAALRPKIKKIITGIGVGAHLERWGYDKKIIVEKNWNEELMLDDGLVVNTTSARHFSGRRFKRNGSVWLSFILTTPTQKIFIGGDSGYDIHFREIGNRFGPFDLAILENGQYNRFWKFIHMMPEEVVQAAIDLKAKKLLPVHWGKFSLSLHDWDEPIKRVTAEAKRKEIKIVHPMIGEPFDLRSDEEGEEWWSEASEKR